jgi:hypothetical protein
MALAISTLEAEEVDPPMVEELSNRRMVIGVRPDPQ